MNVFELNNAIKTVKEKDLDPETLKDTLESLELPRNEKLDNVASWIEENNMKLQWLKEMFFIHSSLIGVAIFIQAEAVR